MNVLKDAAYWARLHEQSDKAKPVTLSDRRMFGSFIRRSAGGYLQEHKL